jgi:phosphoribosyl-AMP cyclohydrolase
MKTPDWLDTVKFDGEGLVVAIAQYAEDGTVLMTARMNRDALRDTVETGRAGYWSRSRKKLWRKGEESGNVQEIVSVALDCDRDGVLLKVRQKGGAACHTGRRSCFFHHAGPDGRLDVRGEMLFDPAKVYKK